MSRLKVIVLQMQSLDDVQANLQQIQNLLQDVPPQQTSALVCLPENALYFRIVEGEKIPGLQTTDPCFLELRKLAQQKNLVFHIGSVPLIRDEKLVNSSVLIWPMGQIEASYQKIHLFDIELEGQAPIRESDVFDPGEGPKIFQVGDWKWGQTICYDLRFAELFSLYAEEQVDALLVPSAFLTKTGEAHWHVLLRARAIETQCFVVAAAQAGVHQTSRGKRETFGHSLVVDPWGRILAEASGDQPEKIEIELDLEQINKVRRQIPMASHRRLL